MTSTRVSRWRHVRTGFTVLYAGSSAVHVYLGLFTPESYRRFADEAYWSWVTRAWHDVFMANPRAWALALAAGELLIAVLLWRSPVIGYLAVIAFTLALTLFGWGFWFWSFPVLTIALPALWYQVRLARQPAPEARG